MRGEVLRETLRARRRSTLWWALGIAALIWITLAAYPSVRDSAGLSDYAEDLPETMRAMFAGGETDIVSGAGYLDSQLFAFTAPLLLLIFSIAMGAAMIAGEEERGTLDLLLAQPLSRTRLVLERFAALCVLVAVLSAVFLASVASGDAVVGLEGVPFGNLVAATVGVALLALLYGALAMAVGCAWPGRGRAIAVPAALALAAWILDSLGQVVDALDSWRPLSPYYQAVASDPLTEGVPVWGWVMLVGLTATLVVAAIAELNNRDVRS
jgi:ABC-2 type transport system permease protein